MRIHTDNNNVRVNAISSLPDGTDVEGHDYQILVGDNQVDLNFQFGPVKENGVNGITNEALLAIIIHRLNSLNTKFPCQENSNAMGKMEEALFWLESRTRNRIKREVEGKNEA